jgi:cAMP phosphodiesterase
MGNFSRAEKTNPRRCFTHAHLDHIAGLPLFIDDLFRVWTRRFAFHAAPQTIETLERDIFNWEIYPRFSELENRKGAVMKYQPFAVGESFQSNICACKPCRSIIKFRASARRLR